ncbi:protein kinase [Xylariaceae sp. FL0016]|nr:protein kinase [Xylariaceae sp. FL0016]
MSSQSRKNVLDNPKRVRKIRDRGQQFLPVQPISDKERRNRSQDFSPKRLICTIAGELDRVSHVTYGFGTGSKYIPRPQLLRILNIQRVRELVGILECFRHVADKEELASRIYSGSNSQAPCLMLLAALIGIEEAEDMQKFMSEGISDRCIPMVSQMDEEGTLFCRHHSIVHQCLQDYGRPKKRSDFLDLSYQLSAPFIQGDSDKHHHYILDPGDRLPMRVVRKVEKADSSGDDPLGAINGGNAYGGFSEVYQVQIMEGHYKFSRDEMRHPKGFFALKKLTSHNRQNFVMEVSSLLFSMDQYPKHIHPQHVIHLLATFEVRSDADSTFYLLFDWAQGTLADFWRVNGHLVRDRHHALDIAKQFHEIATALNYVHNERLETVKSLDSSYDSNLYGRHGDIKPQNLLWFKCQHRHGPSSSELILSDFGLGRLNTRISRSKQAGGALDRSPTYRAPEFDLPSPLVSRVSDIFSLGCVFLEYVIWFLKGPRWLEEFPDARTAPDIYDFHSDTFFTISYDNRTGTKVPVLKKVVLDWIQELMDDKNCSWYIHQLLELIRDEMLNPVREERIKSIPLEKKLEKQRRCCEKSPSFYLTSKDEDRELMSTAFESRRSHRGTSTR